MENNLVMGNLTSQLEAVLGKGAPSDKAFGLGNCKEVIAHNHQDTGYRLQETRNNNPA
jgi:hypothetical protein